MRLFSRAHFNLWTWFFIEIFLLRLKVHPFERKIIIKKFFENWPIYGLADFLFEKLKIGRAALHKIKIFFWDLKLEIKILLRISIQLIPKMISESILKPKGNIFINKINFEFFENFGQIELVIINFFVCALILIFSGATNRSIQDTFVVKNSTWNIKWFWKYCEFLVF